MSFVQPTLTPSQKDEITNYINVYRATNQAPPLVWDDTIYTFAQNWSYQLDVSNVMQHSGSPLYGENIAYLQGYGSDVMTLLKKSVDMWYNEISLYDFNKPGFSSATGHFTCLVWKSSTKFAMGITLKTDTNAVYITMNTSPPGNYVGQFAQNVLPVLTSPGVNVVVPPAVNPTPTTPPTVVPSPPSTWAPTTILPPQLQTHKQLVFQELYKVVAALNANQPKSVIIRIVNNIVQMLNSYPTF